jgi:hypothetical protein
MKVISIILTVHLSVHLSVCPFVSTYYQSVRPSLFHPIQLNNKHRLLSFPFPLSLCLSSTPTRLRLPLFYHPTALSCPLLPRCFLSLLLCLMYVHISYCDLYLYYLTSSPSLHLYLFITILPLLPFHLHLLSFPSLLCPSHSLTITPTHSSLAQQNNCRNEHYYTETTPFGQVSCLCNFLNNIV